MHPPYKSVTLATYDEVARSYDKHTDAEITMLDSFAAALPPNAAVLDVGCGAGRDARYLAQKGSAVTALDNSMKMLEIAKSEDPSMHYVRADMTDLPFADQELDGVWSNAALLHLSKVDFGVALDAVHRVLAPQGVFGLIMMQGEGEGLEERDNFGRTTTRYFARYTDDELANKLSDADFIDAQVHSSADNE